MNNLFFRVLRQILTNQMIMLGRIPATDITQANTSSLIKEINDTTAGNVALQAEAEQHWEWKTEQEIQQLIDEQMQEEANESDFPGKSRIDWKAGDVAIVKDYWEGAGQKLRVFGSAIFCEQWWVPVEDLDDADPTFFKEVGLEKVQ